MENVRKRQFFNEDKENNRQKNLNNKSELQAPKGSRNTSKSPYPNEKQDYQQTYEQENNKGNKISKHENDINSQSQYHQDLNMMNQHQNSQQLQEQKQQQKLFQTQLQLQQQQQSTNSVPPKQKNFGIIMEYLDNGSVLSQAKAATDFRTEIEKKFNKSVANKIYIFPRQELDDNEDICFSADTSLESIKSVYLYQLESQNQSKLNQIKQGNNYFSIQARDQNHFRERIVTEENYSDNNQEPLYYGRDSPQFKQIQPNSMGGLQKHQPIQNQNKKVEQGGAHETPIFSTFGFQGGRVNQKELILGEQTSNNSNYQQKKLNGNNNRVKFHSPSNRMKTQNYYDQKKEKANYDFIGNYNARRLKTEGNQQDEDDDKDDENISFNFEDNGSENSQDAVVLQTDFTTQSSYKNGSRNSYGNKKGFPMNIDNYYSSQVSHPYLNDNSNTNYPLNHNNILSYQNANQMKIANQETPIQLNNNYKNNSFLPNQKYLIQNPENQKKGVKARPKTSVPIKQLSSRMKFQIEQEKIQLGKVQGKKGGGTVNNAGISNYTFSNPNNYNNNNNSNNKNNNLNINSISGNNPIVVYDEQKLYGDENKRNTPITNSNNNNHFDLLDVNLRKNQVNSENIGEESKISYLPSYKNILDVLEQNLSKVNQKDFSGKDQFFNSNDFGVVQKSAHTPGKMPYSKNPTLQKSPKISQLQSQQHHDKPSNVNHRENRNLNYESQLIHAPKTTEQSLSRERTGSGSRSRGITNPGTSNKMSIIQQQNKDYLNEFQYLRESTATNNHRYMQLQSNSEFKDLDRIRRDEFAQIYNTFGISLKNEQTPPGKRKNEGSNTPLSQQIVHTEGDYIVQKSQKVKNVGHSTVQKPEFLSGRTIIGSIQRGKGMQPQTQHIHQQNNQVQTKSPLSNHQGERIQTPQSTFQPQIKSNNYMVQSSTAKGLHDSNLKTLLREKMQFINQFQDNITRVQTQPADDYLRVYNEQNDCLSPSWYLNQEAVNSSQMQYYSSRNNKNNTREKRNSVNPGVQSESREQKISLDNNNQKKTKN